jgi:hypothetical protein
MGTESLDNWIELARVFRELIRPTIWKILLSNLLKAP